MSEARASGPRANQGRVGTVVNGKWQIDARIGSGGMATVYAATHRNGHRAALKMLHTQLSRDEGTRARFLREGYVANAVGHPGVVHVEDDGVTEDGAAFLVLELLEGETMEARRTRLGGAMPIDEALEIADHALDALAAAHEKGIVHRDLKPDNFFLTWNRQVKLLDFGLARMKHSQSEQTKTGVTIGTPAFMPPEQAMGRRDEVDALSDIWGLGATLFTAITGMYVHDAVNLHEQLLASATKRPRSVREVDPHVPMSVAIVIDRALELDKADRWESALEMQRALRAARGPESGTAHYVPDSLTMPAASPASIRRAAGIPESVRPSGGVASSGVPTLPRGAPLGETTFDEAVPITIYLDELPTSSGGPTSPVPHTERLAGAGARGSGAILQAQSQHAQAIAEALGQGPVVGTARPMVPGHFTETLASPVGPPAPPLASAQSSGSHPAFGSGAHPAQGSGPYPALGSGSHPAQGSGAYAAQGSGPYPALYSGGPYPAHGHPMAPPQGSGAYPFASGAHPVTLSSSGGYPVAAPNPPPGPPEPNPSVAPPARRSPRAVLIAMVLLILVCASTGVWMLLHPAFRPFR